ncbi:MAG TPA: prepilin-type N-terminal cleavage/methylation domain-containing protein [Mycobacteriales bacterium]|nr:prepilin-type N-terminal cleavage/methylation domain-containing protein [Mycobacteriales bacterium]
MLARIRKAQEKEGGFTLIELLVVMIIIGILAAIAIPVFLNQRKKANDTAGKADVSTLGKEIATYYVDGTGTPVVAGPAGGRYTVAGADAGKVSNNVAFKSFKATAGSEATTWCVDVTISNGTLAAASYSAADGLALTACP